MIVADLHVHTTRSDGTLPPEKVPEAAREADLRAVAVTDHDRLPPVDAPVVERDGVTVIAGIELRVTTGDQRLDLLGYGIDPTPALRAETERLQRDRIERARKIIDCVEDRLGVNLDLDVHPGVGRPHIAQAVADSHDHYTVQDAFDQLIGTDQPCYVARDLPTVERGRALLEEAAALIGLAHPLRYDDPDAALAHAGSLDAIEREYPYERAVDRTPVDDAIATHDLLATGGSDAHGETLGAAGLGRAGYERVCTALDAVVSGT
ncbi:Metal-dependent phosphoesterase (PHP family) [Halorhabdus sp. SVX81]|uniref:PHP domain-containing protein n=1 Tax=Halorhabdus sp. SVX81 TaxID=2978283 RepID=UPI0023DC2067|nr:PHP domain-containing protein [Halorhabdus sp. SVX81]WEL18694.1 Metal-dependent phosphoesterase (PHP family) [Halorhabdus sp. SVX81]